MSNQEIPSPGKGKLDEEFESRDFQVLETEFQTVLKEIGGDKQLEHFHREYEKHYRILLASHENEKKLIDLMNHYFFLFVKFINFFMAFDQVF